MHLWLHIHIMEAAVTEMSPLEAVFSSPKRETRSEKAHNALEDIAAITGPTESQIRVIQHPATPNSVLKVRAGPGSGKTSTIAGRIAYLLHTEELQPNEVLVLSMANRLVNALRSSIERLVGQEKADQVSISTFHLFCGSLLDQYESHYNANAPRKRLMDDLSWRHFLSFFSARTIALYGQKVGGSLSACALEKMIADVRSGAVSVKDAAKKAFVKKEYIDALLTYMDRNGMIRYHDLIAGALRVMEVSAKSPDPIAQLCAYKAVVVDEFQDMYPLLMDVVDAVVLYPTFGASKGVLKHLTVAGDVNQSIYEFLGSKAAFLDNVGAHLEPDNVVELHIPELFRTTEEILTAASKVCLDSHSLPYAKPQAVRGRGHWPVVYAQNSDMDEFKFISEEITRLICVLGGTLRALDFAILARSHLELDGVLEYMENNYDFRTSRLSLGNTWVKTKLHILPDILNIIHQGPGADFSLMCVLMLLDPAKTSKSRISRLFNAAADEGETRKWNMMESFLVNELHTSGIWPENFERTTDELPEIGQLLLNGTEASEETQTPGLLKHTSKSSKSCSEALSKSTLLSVYKGDRHKSILRLFLQFLAAVQKEREILNSVSQDPNAVLLSLYNILNALGLLEYLNRQVGIHMNSADHEETLYHHLESFNASLRYAYQSYDPQNSIDETFVGHFLCCYDEEIPLEETDSIKLLTIHAAKGLEFPVVFVMRGANFASKESFWSSLLAPKQPLSPTPSKARLLYVACTRARNLLYVGTSTSNDLSRTLQARFTTELPKMDRIVAPTTLLLQSLARDLGRPVPSAKRLLDGQKLYRDLQKRQVRGFHTASSCLVGKLARRR